MPPKSRSKGKAPESRTYHSSPAPHQVTFPPRRRIVKTYGRKSTSARRFLRQQTLTQIDYVTQSTPDEPDPLEDEPVEEPAKRRSKRRKTMGDTPTSSFHTQTLTQLLSEKSFSGSASEEDGRLTIKDPDEEDEGEEEAGDGPHTSEQLGDKASSLVPETPSNQRIKVNLDEVPSSQPTPFTPLLERYTPGSGRSPLVERSTNVDAPPPTEETISKIPRNITIQDTFSPSRSPLSSLPASSLKDEPTPTNRPRRQPLAEIPLPTADVAEGSVLLGESPVRSGKENRKRGFVEIPDSDDDLDKFSPSPLKSSSSKALADVVATPQRGGTAPEDAIPDEEAETTSSEDNAPSTPTPLARRVHIELPPHSSQSVLKETPLKPRNKSSPILPRSVRRHTQLNTQRTVVRETQRDIQKSQYYTQGLESQRVPFDVIHSLGPVTDRTDVVISVQPQFVEAITNGTKDHEFRPYKFPPQILRCWIYTTLPVGEVKYMATLGPPKEPGELDDRSGVGNAEFNAGGTENKFAYELVQVYQLNNPVPLSMMKQHGLGDGPPQKWKYIQPAIVGQLLGNLRCALFADGDDHEDDLLPEGDPAEGEAEADVTISQELEEQIRSDIIRSTQMHSSDAVQEMIPASQGSYPTSKNKSTTPNTSVNSSKADVTDPFVLPPLPATATRSSSRIKTQNQRQQRVVKTPSTVRRTGPVPPSQATTASEASTQVVSPEKSSVPRPVQGSSIPSDDFQDDGSPLRLTRGGLSLGSSQPPILDSLLIGDSRPPPEILDSDDDDDDYDDLN